jgi:hypothetical protein
MAFDGAGNLFVVNRDNNTILKFTPDGIGSVFADTSDNVFAWCLTLPSIVRTISMRLERTIRTDW